MHRIIELRALKQEGHDVIDRLVRLHIPRGRVYELLAKKLGKTLVESAHFRNIYTERELHQAIAALRALERERLAEIQEHHRANLERARVFTFLEQRMQVVEAEEEAWRALPWWRRAIHRFASGREILVLE